MQYFDSLLQYRDLGVLLLRLVVGYTFIYHGWPKLFGGPAMSLKGFASWLASMGLPLPMALALIVGVVETLGGLALILGVGVQLAALLLAINMLVATILKVTKMGKSFAGDGGYEFDLALLAANLFLALNGAGVYAFWR